MSTDLGPRLYEIVPALYRNRDESEDLRRYFDGSGALLDQVRATLAQRLADNFPDVPLDGSAACQEWLIPYFAELLDARLVSPTAEGRRHEVANAVRWRQGKGTLRVVEEIAQSVGGLEIVVQEGWARVATTPRLGVPRLPATAYGYAADVPVSPPSVAARHPGVPSVTVDFRCRSGAVQSDPSVPGAEFSTVDGETYVWRRVSPHGAPCHPGTYEDASRRTVDFRESDWRVGHYHPKKVLLHAVPPAGLFVPAAQEVAWSDAPAADFTDAIEIERRGTTTIYRARTLDTPEFVPVWVTGSVELGQVPSGTGDPDFHTWRFEGLVFTEEVIADSGRLEFDRCAAVHAEAHGIDTDSPVISARSSVLGYVQSARGLTRLEYCTVFDTILSEAVQISDCILMGPLRRDHGQPEPPEQGCVRYSRVRPDQDLTPLPTHATTTERPEFVTDVFGDRSHGVLHPATAVVIRHGAEDGGEMGAYHDAHYSLGAEAVVDKLHDFLPVGLEAVVIPDPRLVEIATLPDPASASGPMEGGITP